MNENQDLVTNWWEKKRPLFNLVILLISFYEIAINNYNPLLSDGQNQLIDFNSIDNVLWVTFFANLPYCIGTGIENTNRNSNKNRYNSWFLFTAGILVAWIFIKMNY